MNYNTSANRGNRLVMSQLLPREAGTEGAPASRITFARAFRIRFLGGPLLVASSSSKTCP